MISEEHEVNGYVAQAQNDEHRVLVRIHSEINTLIQINSAITKFCEQNKNSTFREQDAFCGTRDHRVVKFVPASEIQDFLTKTFKRFIDIYDNAINQDQIEFSMAYIWLGLISIHPFKNGNGRTAKHYISEKLKEKDYELKSTAELDAFILDENTHQNLTALIKIFKKNIFKHAEFDANDLRHSNVQISIF